MVEEESKVIYFLRIFHENQNAMLYSKSFLIEKDSIFITYDVEISIWNRIKEAALFLSNNNLGPIIKSIHNKIMTIVTERVNVFSNENPPDGVTAKRARNAINKSINKLHNAGWVHGDLAICNIGYRDNLEVIFFEYDTIHRVTENIPKWFQDWREKFFDEIDVTYESVIECEKTSLYDDWLDF